ncbi:hypothetical protein LTR94_024833 [Friedmanniomyces endolithicus]|nr:hypothetical protein LTR94_024833 [Friedmanniomyces endolithicus]
MSRHPVFSTMAVLLPCCLWAAPAYADPCEGALPARNTSFEGVVRYIGDGDGLCVGPAGRPDRWIEVRLADFYAPELHDRGGLEAKRRLERLLRSRDRILHAAGAAAGRLAASASWRRRRPRVEVVNAMLDLFGEVALPGLATAEAFVTPAEETALIAHIDDVGLSPFKFQQWTGKRLTRSFGWSYDFETGRFAPADPIPSWLEPIRQRASRFAGLGPDDLVQALVIRYDTGAGIGWHKDRPAFEA